MPKLIEQPLLSGISPDSKSSETPHANLVKFSKPDSFMSALRERIDEYFVLTNQSKRDHPRMYVKTITILLWLLISYVGIVFWATTWPLAILTTVSLGIAMAAVGFNIQHDGGHGAYSKFAWMNRMMALTLDMLGGSSFVWKRTHNIIHHSYTNVTGVDGDIDLGFLGRLSPHQPCYAFHRFQHLYLWILYGFITFKWQFRDDFQALLIGRIGTSTIPRPRGWELATFVLGKMVFLTLAFGVPLYFNSWYYVAAGFVGASFVQGILLSIVFQLAHSVESADFPLPNADTRRLENTWAIHQVETTVDFARKSWLATWFTGGLNFQIEHHLFPHICHIHYPAMSKIVESTAAEFGVRYQSHPTFFSAIQSHYRWLKAMGQAG